jgi:alpha-L-arabinofuranosidase
MSRMFDDLRLPHRRGIGIVGATLLCLVLSVFVVANPRGGNSALAASSAQVTVNANQSLGTLTNISKGLNTAVWDGNLLDSAATTAVKNAGVGLLRYPGGSTSDVYHWQSNTSGTTGNGNNNFDNFMKMAQTAGVQPMITVNYGSGTPQEAAGWVQYANKGGSGYNGPVPTYSGGSSTGHNYGIKYWEVGNEVYGNGTYGGSWETDNHAHTAATYASNVVAFSQAMKAADSTIDVGAVLTTPNNWPFGVTNSSSPQPWNTTVLSTACSSIDFVIAHWYAQNPGSESDSTLLSAPAQIASMTSTLRSEINQYCGSHASAVKIMVTETNSVSSNPGKQTVSTVNALFMADNYTSWLENGVSTVDWWTLHNGPVVGNTSSSLYGNAQYGDYGVLADGGCTAAGSGICEPSANTPFPAYYGLLMLNYLEKAGDTMVSSSSTQSLVAVHAVKQANGNLAVLLINKDPNSSYTVSLGLNGYTAASSATVYTYGENSSSISSTSGSSSSVTLAPYSMSTLVLSPSSGATPTPTPPVTPTPTPPVTPTPTHTPTVTPTPTSTPVSGAKCSVHYVVTNQWPGGFGGSLTITNTGSSTINGWSLHFSFANGQTITQGWNGIFTQAGSSVTIANFSYNASLAPGASVNPGFNGSWNGSNTNPTAFTLNGQACSVV